MNCPNCSHILPDNISNKINFCPFCGGKLFEDGKDFMLEISCTGQRNLDGGVIMLFLDDSTLYEIQPGDNIYIKVRAGFHTMKFRHKIRNKTIHVLVTNNYSIRAYYNSLSGLIETVISEVDDKQYARTFSTARIAKPTMVTTEGERGLDILLGEDDPEYEINATSGFKEGILRIYAERCEFSSEKDFNKEVVQYKDVIAIKKKMGSLDIQCAGNVHKVYSIPKDIYNEVLAFLTNRVETANAR